MNPGQIDFTVGLTAAVGGSTGTVIHIVSTSLSILTLVINLAVGIGGMYLLYRRLKKLEAKKEE